MLGTALTPLTGRGVRLFGRRRFVIGAIVVWAGAILLTLVPSLPAIITGLAVAAACGFVCQASSTSYVAISAKQGVSAAVGLYVTFFYVGGSVGALLPGLAWQSGGWPATVTMVVAMLATMGAIVAITWRRDH